MIHDNFVKMAQEQDPRNEFQQCDTDLSFIPDSLRSFFNLYNPVDVEIALNDSNSIRFCPVQHLEQLQKDYALDEFAFVFATKEGDPIYFRPEGIFICAHGSALKQESKITNSFDDFLELLTTEMIKEF